MKKRYVLISLYTSLTIFGAKQPNTHSKEIIRLKEQHDQEISFYQEKIADLMATNESLN